jgi:predicted DNA-binding transcriptional regulator YafY
MPVNKNANLRYNALDRCFRNIGKHYHIDDLVDACNEALGNFNGVHSSVEKRSVYNDIRYMKSESGYAAPIETYQIGRRTYYRYEDRNFSINNQPINKIEARQMQSALSVFHRFKGLPQFEWLQEIMPKMQIAFGVKIEEEAIFQFEQNIYLKGIEYIEILYQHILRKDVLKITFQDFGDSPAVVYTLHPYLLKQYNKRWFLVSQNHENQRIWVTALDRIEAVHLAQGIPYCKNTVNLEEYFDDVLGVTKYKDAALQKIRLKVYSKSMAYVTTKPLHASQKKVEATDDYIILELELMWNYELESLILSYGDQMELLSPPEFRLTIKERLIATRALYE